MSEIPWWGWLLIVCLWRAWLPPLLFLVGIPLLACWFFVASIVDGSAASAARKAREARARRKAGGL